ncbi:hypothetical protein CLAFUW4_10266 [Fulvia fulva]|uniref:F-box domain-containing protein n=1 Tax=Passalora fulva TaxID=5499 RepID=A0A9Q8P8G4_PASFU|nr:uncharacterized protein CLAFUR5_04880 [Fulvia fulva]KAK4615368.1 hypothetical protein CLAFUR4_10270 [Fulvia fulva]KAK4617028.1 hypothetical protein CLAFUR0_10268 [Fulvia fulva]UJO17113.1 hypothetical protein CLAFUR5_04880 [Fulvia fulva]WPV18819.1 hypothetical protein CLAFUW4_10266 [Fulvia fulva]WPV34159.1 hypothetical protein CLAFUW7_10266 [Fulvia fulva]
MILEKLAFEDLIRAQSICKKTREVTRSSLRIMPRHAALSTEYRDDQALINKHIDFDLTLVMCPVDDIGGRFHLIGSNPYDSYDLELFEGPYLFCIGFLRSLEAQPTWDFCSDYGEGWDGKEGDKLHTRTVIIQGRDGETQCLWRYLKVAKLPASGWRLKQEYDGVQITLRSDCYQGHPVKEVKVFPTTVTIGEAWEWLHERVEARHPADPCPDDQRRDAPESTEHRIEY